MRGSPWDSGLGGAAVGGTGRAGGTGGSAVLAPSRAVHARTPTCFRRLPSCLSSEDRLPSGQGERVCGSQAKGVPEGEGGGLGFGEDPPLTHSLAWPPPLPLPSPGLLSSPPSLCALGHAHPVTGRAPVPVITGPRSQLYTEASLLSPLSPLDRGGASPGFSNVLGTSAGKAAGFALRGGVWGEQGGAALAPGPCPCPHTRLRRSQTLGPSPGTASPSCFKAGGHGPREGG